MIRFKPSPLSDDQKSWISSTGFGSVLSFQSKEYPVEISAFLLSSFEPNPPVLRTNESIFEINEEDVREIMGSPVGEQDIVFVERTDVIKSLTNNLTRAKHCYQVTPSDLCKAITANQAADEEFKLNFIVLLSNALIEGSSTPYVNNNMVQFAGDIDNYNIYNWCRYLIQCLQK